ncbi:hypothetical protein DFH09DRAFT_1145536 [Mycena vulgaris]|nr:hypothetical protein DFH09DRAFT_1145536 [Mycena vulgaris]
MVRYNLPLAYDLVPRTPNILSLAPSHQASAVHTTHPFPPPRRRRPTRRLLTSLETQRAACFVPLHHGAGHASSGAPDGSYLSWISITLMHFCTILLPVLFEARLLRTLSRTRHAPCCERSYWSARAALHLALARNARRADGRPASLRSLPVALVGSLRRPSDPLCEAALPQHAAQPSLFEIAI